MDVLVEPTGKYPRRVAGVTVLKPAASNWEVQLPEAMQMQLRTTQLSRNYFNKNTTNPQIAGNKKANR
ncbi:hypothetical protein [Shewanella cutis]|uniref:Uncharacterized protein n=1 Tax=Shewanella cutis TaxID=2766780 RepID=A0ABS9QVK0_9GAMM|nr:hypothetical protein [Shewanella sp. PS-2]MCG9964393.1 hypothetical protein [Shewanella sp. PS-2]